MSYDIYGEILYPGNCEVHPYYPESYPCSLCLKESQEKERHRQQEVEYCKEMEKEYNEWVNQQIIETVENTEGMGI